MKSTTHVPALIALAVAAALAGAAAPQAAASVTPAVSAQADQECQRRNRRDSSSEPAERYPEATRESPGEGASSRMVNRLNRLNSAMDEEDHAQVVELADEIFDQDRANDYDKAYAANLAAHASYNEDDIEAAKRYISRMIELDALDNNNHFQGMLMLAQLHAQEDETDQALAVLGRYLEESGSTRGTDFALQGQLLYNAERYDEAVTALNRAIESDDEPHTSWNQLLMAIYAETGRDAEATQLAEQIAAQSPDDKRSQINLASMYMQVGQNDRAIEVMERLRASGELTEDREYRNLMAMHLNTEGGETAAIAVINEGLEKGILQESHQTYLALGQAYYFSDQVEPAVEAYRKAAPLADDGETWLNLARVLYGEGRESEAAEAARQALDKGIRNPQDARRMLGN